MSLKNNDAQGRFRDVVVAFRMSHEERDVLTRKIELSGLNKQDYCIARLNENDVIVEPCHFVIKQIRHELYNLITLLEENKEISKDDEEVFKMCKDIIAGFAKEENKNVKTMHNEDSRQ